MRDEKKTKEQLIDELTGLRGRVAELEAAQSASSKQETLFYQADLIQHVSDAIIATDMNLRIKSWNKSAEQMYGWQEHEVIGQHLDELLKTEFFDEPQSTAQKQLQAEKYWHGLVQQRCRDGRQLYIMASVALIVDSDGRPVGGVTVNRNITRQVQAEQRLREYQEELEALVESRTFELKQVNEQLKEEVKERQRSEEALIRSEEKHRNIFENSSLGIFQSTLEDKFFNVNPALARMLGYESPQQVIDSIYSISEQIYADPSRREEIVGLLREAEGVVKFENQYLRKDGQEWTAYLQVRVVRDGSGRPLYLEGFVEDVTERRQVEKALRESEERYRALVNASPSSIMVVQEGRYVFANPAGARMLGFSDPAELVGVSVLDTVVPDQQPLLEERLRRLDAGRTNAPIEVEVSRRDGISLFVETTSVSITFEGRPAALVIGLNITERKEIEQKLQVSEARYRTLFEQANDAIFLTRLDDEIIDVNRRACEMLGYTREELLRLKVPDIQAIEVRGQSGTVITTELEQYGEEPFEAIDIHRDGTRIPVEVSTAQIAGEADQNMALSIVRDITERKLAEKALRESESLFRLLFQHAPIGMAMTSLEGHYLRVNQSLCDTLGYTMEELVGRSFHDFSHHEDLTLNLALRDKVFAGEINQFQMEKRFITKQEKTVFTILQVTLIRNHENQPLHFIGQVVDITERKRVEETLKRRNSELALLNRVSQTLNSTLDLDQRLRTILEEVRQLLKVVACSVWLVDTGTGELVCHQATGPKHQIVQGWRLSQDQGLVGWVAKHGQSLIVPDTQNNPQHATAVAEETGLSLRSILTVPLQVQEATIGVLQAVSEEIDQFTTADLLLLESLAVPAAIAVENARLYEQARQNAETKTMLLQEVNHRVGNNLTAITGMLALERRHIKEADQAAYQAIMTDLTNRVMGLATVHNMLSDSEWDPLPLDELTRQIIHSSLQMLPLDKFIEVDVTSSPVLVNPDQAHHLALAVNELATNTIKYALLDRTSASITVGILFDGNVVRLEYKDDGPGYPESVLQLEHFNVGLELIRKITRHLRGRWFLANRSGAVTVMEFDLDAHSSKEKDGDQAEKMSLSSRSPAHE